MEPEQARRHDAFIHFLSNGLMPTQHLLEKYLESGVGAKRFLRQLKTRVRQLRETELPESDVDESLLQTVFKGASRLEVSEAVRLWKTRPPAPLFQEPLLFSLRRGVDYGKKGSQEALALVATLRLPPREQARLAFSQAKKALSGEQARFAAESAGAKSLGGLGSRLARTRENALENALRATAKALFEAYKASGDERLNGLCDKISLALLAHANPGLVGKDTSNEEAFSNSEYFLSAMLPELKRGFVTASEGAAGGVQAGKTLVSAFARSMKRKIKSVLSEAGRARRVQLVASDRVGDKLVRYASGDFTGPRQAHRFSNLRVLVDGKWRGNVYAKAGKRASRKVLLVDSMRLGPSFRGNSFEFAAGALEALWSKAAAQGYSALLLSSNPEHWSNHHGVRQALEQLLAGRQRVEGGRFGRESSHLESVRHGEFLVAAGTLVGQQAARLKSKRGEQ